MMKMTPRETGREREEGEGEKEGRGSTTFRKYALGWNDFLLDRVAECFRERCLHSRKGASFPDSTLLIVPTAEAGRLLREAIAEKFRPEGGIVSLHVETPACLATPQRPCADSVLTSSRWIRVLKAIKAEEYPNLLKGLEKYRNTEYQIAMFFVINATSIQILPTSVLALRTSLNAAAPSDIILPTILATAVSTAAGILLVKMFLRKKRK